MKRLILPSCWQCLLAACGPPATPTSVPSHLPPTVNRPPPPHTAYVDRLAAASLTVHLGRSERLSRLPISVTVTFNFAGTRRWPPSSPGCIGGCFCIGEPHLYGQSGHSQPGCAGTSKILRPMCWKSFSRQLIPANVQTCLIWPNRA